MFPRLRSACASHKKLRQIGAKVAEVRHQHLKLRALLFWSHAARRAQNLRHFAAARDVRTLRGCLTEWQSHTVACRLPDDDAGMSHEGVKPRESQGVAALGYGSVAMTDRGQYDMGHSGHVGPHGSHGAAGMHQQFTAASNGAACFEGPTTKGQVHPSRAYYRAGITPRQPSGINQGTSVVGMSQPHMAAHGAPGHLFMQQGQMEALVSQHSGTLQGGHVGPHVSHGYNSGAGAEAWTGLWQRWALRRGLEAWSTWLHVTARPRARMQWYHPNRLRSLCQPLPNRKLGVSGVVACYTLSLKLSPSGFPSAPSVWAPLSPLFSVSVYKWGACGCVRVCVFVGVCVCVCVCMRVRLCACPCV
jgi:hypothetical protein